MGNNVFHKIILPTRPQPDTILGIFFLRKFGGERYPGVENAGIEIMQRLPGRETPQSLESQGILALDIGGGRFDHHQKGKTLSQLIAEDLGIESNTAVSKLLVYSERDDKYGMGTISVDQIDKAFGLSGLISALNKAYPEYPGKVIGNILPLLEAHYREEKNRTEELPKEFEEKLGSGKAEIFEIRQRDKKLKVVCLESDNLSMAGWLRSSAGIRADVVCQKVSSGYVNILTRPLKRINLQGLALCLRQEEASLRGRSLNCGEEELMRAAKIDKIPEWYYDRATNSMLNGGTNPKGIEPTAISLEIIKELLKKGLPQAPANYPAHFVRNNMNNSTEASNAPSSQYFLEIRLPIDAGKKIKSLLADPPAGIKAHLPDNYHITLVYLGSVDEKGNEVVEGIHKSLTDIKTFEIIINSDNFHSGQVAGYSTRAFYFAIGDEEGGNTLKKIRSNLEKNISWLKQESFIPHLTVAAVLPRIDEKIANDAEINIKKGEKISFLVDKIRLTEVYKKPNGGTGYKKAMIFELDKNR
jgi:2'-5' RNA ligase